MVLRYPGEVNANAAPGAKVVSNSEFSIICFARLSNCAIVLAQCLTKISGADETTLRRDSAQPSRKRRCERRGCDLKSRGPVYNTWN